MPERSKTYPLRQESGAHRAAPPKLEKQHQSRDPQPRDAPSLDQATIRDPPGPSHRPRATKRPEPSKRKCHQIELGATGSDESQQRRCALQWDDRFGYAKRESPTTQPGDPVSDHLHTHCEALACSKSGGQQIRAAPATAQQRSSRPPRSDECFATKGIASSDASRTIAWATLRSCGSGYPRSSTRLRLRPGAAVTGRRTKTPPSPLTQPSRAHRGRCRTRRKAAISSGLIAW